MIKCVILFTTLGIDSLSLISIPVPRNSPFLSCLQTIVQKHIAQGTNLVVSFPAYRGDTMLTSSQTETSQLVDSVLRNINGETDLPVHLHQLETKLPNKYPYILPYKHDSYVIFTLPVMEMETLLLLISQVQAISSLISFSPHARFFFVVTGNFAKIKLFLNSEIFNLW
jgi:hypothetical protein